MLFFFTATAFQLYYLHQRIEHSPDLDLNVALAALDSNGHYEIKVNDGLCQRRNAMATHRRFAAMSVTVLFTLLSTSTLLVLPPIVRADERLSDLRKAFYNGRYAEVLTRLYDYREQPYGKQVKWITIGSCLCRTGSRDKARKRFEWILARYRLHPGQRNIIEWELRDCSVGGPSRPASFRQSNTVTSASESTVGVSGKGGTITRVEPVTTVAESIVAVTSETAAVIREIPPEEFESRLFDLSERDKAIQRVTALADPEGGRLLHKP